MQLLCLISWIIFEIFFLNYRLIYVITFFGHGFWETGCALNEIVDETTWYSTHDDGLSKISKITGIERPTQHANETLDAIADNVGTAIVLKPPKIRADLRK